MIWLIVVLAGVVVAAIVLWPSTVQPPGQLKLSFERTASMQLNCNLKWPLSPAAGVVSQSLDIKVNDQEIAGSPFTLSPTTATYSFLVNEKDRVAVSLTCTDGTMTSAASVASGTAPEVTPPAPPGAITIDFSPVSGS